MLARLRNLDGARGVKAEVKRLIRLTFVFVVAAVVALGASLSAIAKGPSRAVIEGPGISSPIALPGPNEATIGPELAALVMDSGLFTGLWCRTCDGRLRHSPSEQLGPRYTITYAMTMTSGKGTRSNPVVQYVFPYAVPDPVTYVPAGQRFSMRATLGGWFIAGPKLRRLMDLGVPTEASAHPARGDGANEGGISMRTVLPITAAAVVLAALVLVTRRMRRRPIVDVDS
jgi:hypothetical protein